MRTTHWARKVLRLLAALGLVTIGVLFYAICVDIFGGYPQAHSELLSWIAVLAIVAGGLVVWYRDERR